MPNKLLGQHFLKNASAIKKIVDAIAPAEGEIIFEIGPGHGELTLELLHACENSGAAIVAIEKDPQLADALVHSLTNAPASKLPRRTANDHAKVISGDALKILGEEVNKTSQPFKIVGNLPYYLTGHLLRIIGELDKEPVRCVFTIQKEVAERITAQAPKMNRLAASVQLWAEPKIVSRISKNDFHPVPKVDSAVIVLETAESGDTRAIEKDRYYAMVRTLFAQPRKTIMNNLRAAIKDEKEIAAVLRTIGVEGTARPQDLSSKNIKAIAKQLHS